MVFKLIKRLTKSQCILDGTYSNFCLILYNAAREFKFTRAILYINHITMKYSSEAFFP